MYTCARCKSKITKQKKTHKNYINWDVAVEGVKLARVFFMNRHLMLYGRIHTSILKKYTCILLGLNYLYGGGGNNCSGGGPRSGEAGDSASGPWTSDTQTTEPVEAAATAATEAVVAGRQERRRRKLHEEQELL
jgi:hypothetical protein